jgi:hypothetical protein
MYFKSDVSVGTYELTYKEPISELKEMTQPYNVGGQAQAEASISENKFIIGSVDSHGYMSIAENPVIHPTEYSAMLETRRLAKLSPGKTFMVLQFISGARAGGLLEF